IEKIMEVFDTKEDIAHVAVFIDNSKVAENDYNLSVSSYIEAKDNKEKVDIVKLNAEISKTVEKINKLRVSIDEIINEIEA
ncbi:MAG TPA: N-6 DNA methylase, partial [Sediminibacterium sp.]